MDSNFSPEICAEASTPAVNEPQDRTLLLRVSLDILLIFATKVAGAWA